MTQRIVPHLWFAKDAHGAAKYYCSVFPDSQILATTTLHNTPSNDCHLVSFKLAGYEFAGISTDAGSMDGPMTKMNPSVSFILNFDPSVDKDAQENLEALWKELSAGAKVLMELGEYPFSKRYGWLEDKHGVSWQLMLSNPTGEVRPFIIPSLLFVGDVSGKAEEASDLYISAFDDAKRGRLVPNPPGVPDERGGVMFSDFMLANQWFAAMDGGNAHQFAFNEAISFLVLCDTQEEIDHYWSKLSSGGGQCGWTKDPYGLSWQISLSGMIQMLSDGTREQCDRLMQAFMQMKKVDVAKLKEAYGGVVQKVS